MTSDLIQCCDAHRCRTCCCFRAKKKSLKQLKAGTQRSYASQSVAKKPAPEPVKEETTDNPEDSSSKSHEAADSQQEEAVDPEAQMAAIERQLLQQMAERVRPMVQKEVSRLTKMYDYERRLARNYPMFAWPKPELQQRVLDIAAEEQAQNGACLFVC